MVNVQQFQLALETDGPRFLPTEVLLQMFRDHREMQEDLLGEILFRSWLFPKGAFREALLQTLRAAGISPDMAGQSGLRPTPTAFLGYLDRMKNAFPKPVDYARRHAKSFDRCEGIIPVLAEGREAIAIPFRFSQWPATESLVHDLAGRTIPAWTKELCAVESACESRIRCELLIFCGSRVDLLAGSSFGLPVVIVHARKASRLPEFSALQVVATGCIAGGMAGSADGLPAKRALAESMGAHFFTPGQAMQGGHTSTCAEVIAEFSRFLDDSGLSRLSVKETLEKLEQLCDDLHNGQITPDAAKRSVEFFLQNIPAEARSPLSLEVRVLGDSILASAANHLGDSAAARTHLQAAQPLCEDRNNPNFLVNHMATLVVQRTDAFDLRQAEHWGRKLLDFVETRFVGSAEARLQAEMKATGALGGQPLLSLALRGEADPEESRKLLERNLSLAKELEMPSECCRGIAQLALWHACFRPARFEHDILPEAEGILGKYHVDDRISAHYLNAYRLMAARRRTLFGDGLVAQGFSNWKLPDADAGAPPWLRATALKYLATLHARSGNLEEAKASFQTARKLLSGTQPPILQMISASILLEWLLVSDHVSDPCETRSVLASELRNCVLSEASRWLEKVEGGGSPQALLQLAREFRY